jgi:hypothetical protein
MTLLELRSYSLDLFDSILLWFLSGLRNLVYGDWWQLTIGQVIFFAFVIFYLYSKHILIKANWYIEKMEELNDLRKDRLIGDSERLALKREGRLIAEKLIDLNYYIRIFRLYFLYLCASIVIVSILLSEFNVGELIFFKIYWIFIPVLFVINISLQISSIYLIYRNIKKLNMLNVRLLDIK